MTERSIDTAFWTDSFIAEVCKDAKLLHLYCWSNDHCNQAGAYEVSLKTVGAETGIPEDLLPELFEIIKPKIVWYPDMHLIWVKNFIKRQAKSPKFLIAAARCLTAIHSNGLIKEILEYNRSNYGISIPYQYDTDRVEVSPVSASKAKSRTDLTKKERVVKGEKSTLGATPSSESEIEKSLSAGDKEVISVWRSVKGFNLNEADVADLVVKLRKEFPDVDILAESKAWAARKLSEPLTQKSRPSGQIWNWMKTAREFAKQRGGTYAGGTRIPKPGRGAGQQLATDEEREKSLGAPLHRV